MKYDNPSIKQSVTEGLQEYYGITLESIEFKPVGEESYSYLVIDKNTKKYFVKYCDKANILKNIDFVNQALVQLKNFNFVVPPIDVNGITSFTIFSGKMYVYPYIHGSIVTIGNEQFDASLVNRLLDIMVAIHSSKDQITVNLPVENFENDFLLELESLFALQAKAENKLISLTKSFFAASEKTIRNVIKDHTKIGDYYNNNRPQFVLTHGDITGRNIILTKDYLKLVDWDGAMITPPERDLNFLTDNPHFSVQEYLKKIGLKSYDPKLKEYYSQQWALGSIIGNLKNIFTLDLTPEDQVEYLNEAKKYLEFYQ